MTLADIKKNWASLTVIGGIVAFTFYGLSTLDARAAEVAKKEVQATVNKEMIDGAKKAAADAVKEITPEIAKLVTQEVVKQAREAEEKKKAEKK